MTLLEMTQNILSDMDSDEVNSISDTVEALQVANIIKDTYYNIMAEQFFPMEALRVQLTAASDTDKPTHFTIPDNTEKIFFIKYDTRDAVGDKLEYRDMTYMSPKEFMDFSFNRDSTDSAIQTVTDDSGTRLLIKNDADPQYWTSFDDEVVIFDAFDSAIDDTLQADKIIAYAEKGAVFTLTDTFIADNLPSKAFPYFLSEAKSMCFVNLKQQANPKVEQLAKRLRGKLIQQKQRVGDSYTFTCYGR